MQYLSTDAQSVRVTRKANATRKTEAIEIPEDDSTVRYTFPIKKSENSSR